MIQLTTTSQKHKNPYRKGNNMPATKVFHCLPLLFLLTASAATAAESTTLSVTTSLHGLSGNYRGGFCDSFPLTFDFNFAGQTVSDSFPGCGGTWCCMGKSMTSTLSPEQVYSGYVALTISTAEICCSP